MLFSTQSMQDIIIELSEKAKRCKAGEHFSFEIVDPDLGEGYAGETIEIEGKSYLCRSYRSWTDLAELLMCKMMTPEKGSYPLVTMHFKKLETESSFHTRPEGVNEEKYGAASHFWRIRKMEEPAFYYYYTQALKNAKLSKRRRILNLGINRGDEFAVIKNTLDAESFEKMELVGVDHSRTAIAYAEARFPEAHVKFHLHDINDLGRLNPGRFDLLISIGTLQSPGIHFKPFFMSLVQDYLEKDAAVILGFPNSRWVGGEMLYGAKAPNYAMSEMSLLFNDVMFCKKYLQQKKYRVTLTGKQYIFLTATKII